MKTHRPVVKPSGLLACGPSSSHTRIVNTQCQATTTSKLNARMKSTYLSRPFTVVPVAVVVTLLIGNILSNRVMPAALYVPTNLVTAAVVVFISTRLVTPYDMGMTNWARGARWGLAVTLAGFSLYVVALLTPGLDELFNDRRVDGGIARLIYEVSVRIPLGTVLVEEIAFRGALPAVFAKHMSTFRAS